MAESIWQHIQYLNLLWLLIPLVGIFLFGAEWRKRKLARCADRQLATTMRRGVNRTARITGACLLVAAVTLMIVALARPAWNKTSKPLTPKGRDVVFVLDVSRSMLAQHRNTTRLEEAKFAIQECLNTIRGDRVALVIFAGNAKIACPLTHDYAFFLAKLNDVDYRSVTFGGTMIGDALRLAANNIFKNKARMFRDVILITDGEDMGSEPIKAAERLAELEARIIAVGMGDDTPQPLVIHTPDGKTETITDDKGQTVKTAINLESLKEMAEKTTEGACIPVHSDMTLDLNAVYEKLIKTQEKRDFEKKDVTVYEEKFQLFLMLALLCLAIMKLLPDRRQTVTLILALLCLPVMAQDEEQQTPQSIILKANDLMDEKEYEQAEELLQEAVKLDPLNPIPHYNLGTLAYRKQDYQKAIQNFTAAADLLVETEEPEDRNIRELKANAYAASASAYFQLSKQTPQADDKHPEDPMESLKKKIDLAQNAVKNFQKAMNLVPQSTSQKKNLNAAKLNAKTLKRQLKLLKKQQQKEQDKKGQDKDGKQNQQKDQKKDGKQDQKKDQKQDQKQDQKKDQKQDQKKDGKQDQKQDQQKDQKQDQQKDQKQQQDLEKLEQQQRQAAQDLKNPQKSQQDLQKQQKDLNQEAQQQLDRQQEKKQDPQGKPNQKAEDFLKEARKKQSQAQQQLEQNQREKAQQSQKEAADLTRMARHALKQQKQQKGQDKDQKQPEQQQQQPKPEEKPKQQQPPKQPDLRTMDAIQQEQRDKKDKQKFLFALPMPARNNHDW